MPRSPMASRTSSSLNGLMIAMTSFMEFVPTGRSLPRRGILPAWPDCARSDGRDQAQTMIEVKRPCSTARPALADQAFLRDRGDEGAVAGEDQPPRQPAGAGQMRAVLGEQQPVVGSERPVEPQGMV